MIKMPLGVEVGLGPGHNVLDGDPAPLTHFGEDPNFGGVIRHFHYSSITRKIIKTCVLSKLSIPMKFLHNDKDHQMPFLGGPNRRITNPRWRTAAILEKSKKSPYLSNGLTDRHEIWHGDAH